MLNSLLSSHRKKFPDAGHVNSPMIFDRDRGIHVLMIPAYEPDQLPHKRCDEGFAGTFNARRSASHPRPRWPSPHRLTIILRDASTLWRIPSVHPSATSSSSTSELDMYLAPADFL